MPEILVTGKCTIFGAGFLQVCENMHQTSSTYSAWENVVSHMFTPKETGSKLGLKPLARWNRDRTQANSRLKSHQVYADSNGILWPGMLTRHLLSFEPFFLKLDTWWRVISFSLVDELVCFNEHNETSKENEKHRVPSWQWYFKGTVCSESCAGTYLTNKSCPSPSESVSPVSPRQTEPRMQALSDKGRFC